MHCKLEREREREIETWLIEHYWPLFKDEITNNHCLSWDSHLFLNLLQLRFQFFRTHVLLTRMIHIVGRSVGARCVQEETSNYKGQGDSPFCGVRHCKKLCRPHPADKFSQVFSGPGEREIVFLLDPLAKVLDAGPETDS
jgi:hypothetical protein